MKFILLLVFLLQNIEIKGQHLNREKEDLNSQIRGSFLAQQLANFRIP